MEPTNHPCRKENDLNQTSMIMFHVNLQGCTVLLAQPVNVVEDGSMLLISAILVFKGLLFRW